MARQEESRPGGLSYRGGIGAACGMARGTLSHARVACEGPRPTVKGGVPRAARGHLRSGERKLQTEKATVLDTVARGPVPREAPV